MARLQDFQTVTPASNDNLLIVQSQGQGLSTLENIAKSMNYDLKAKHLATAGTYRVVATNQYQTVIILGYVNGGHSFYTFMATDPSSVQQVYGSNKFTVSRINSTTFDLTVGGSSDFYLMGDLVSITKQS